MYGRRDYRQVLERQTAPDGQQTDDYVCKICKQGPGKRHSMQLHAIRYHNHLVGEQGDPEPVELVPQEQTQAADLLPQQLTFSGVSLNRLQTSLDSEPAPSEEPQTPQGGSTQNRHQVTPSELPHASMCMHASTLTCHFFAATNLLFT